MVKGYWIPVLHQHLPFVKHPEHDYFLEEHWLFEAITESYIPLLIKMEKLADKGVDFRLTMSISPPLSEMFSDAYLMERYLKYLDKLIKLTKNEINRLKHDRNYLPLAHFYNNKFKEVKTFFINFLNYNVLNGYRHFLSLGKLEIITSCATHGFLPLLSINPKAVEVQVSVAVDTHIRHFGKRPNGIWLPECAYYKNLENILEKYDLMFFFSDSNGLMNGRPSPKYTVYAPVYTENGVAVFGRDPLSSRQVWSTDEGYPGDDNYRDFYRDIGFDLDFEYIKPYISPDGIRVFTGIKYHRITNDANDKQPYIPEKALKKSQEHAVHFHSERKNQADNLFALMDRLPLIVSPYDAELFGHWWFEGHDFLYYIFCEIDFHKDITTITPTKYLDLHPQNQVISLSPSSWGYKGYYETWLNSENDWIYTHLHHMAQTLEDIADRYYHETDSITIRVLNQLTRELLLAQSSDWAFLMATKTAKEYSTKRTKEHISNFNRLLDDFSSNRLDINFLEWTECKNSIFKELDFRVFASKRT
ncbi:MAG: DUF1957 domain-containing protein [Planctomycetes bacterium]|nr:DUF1957 domain-containing protein [Planctomycetota bacterium]